MADETRETGQPRTKEEAQQELVEKFGMRKTSDFQGALQRGEVDKAKQWLQYIVDNKDNFPQYWQYGNWDSWLADRQKEIVFYEEYQKKKSAGEKIEEIVPRTKEVAQMELLEKFGMRKTSDFQSALRRGDLKNAKAWLQYIIDNRDLFPQYHSTWDSWLADRQREITEAAEK